MNDLVFLEPNKIDAVPFTTSKVIAENTGIAHRYIKKQIETHQNALKEFGLLVAHATESTGGRPEEITDLNEPQATLLITFLKNTEPVVKFKVNLVKAFFAMKQELFNRRTAKIERKPIRLSLTDAIDALLVSPNKGRKYGQYTDLIYKTLLGKSAKQIREENNAPRKATASDYLMAEQLIEITKMECRVAVLIEMGLDYYQIKALLLNRQMVAA